MKLKQTLTAAAIMLLTSVWIPYFTSSNDQPLKQSLSRFPLQIGDWRGTTSRFKQKIYDVLGVDDSLLANYYNHSNEHIQLYIGYYKSQREGDIIHSPKNCMPGAGWDIAESSMLTLNTENGGNAKIIKLVLENGLQRKVVLYWFHSRGRVINSEYAQKIYLVLDAITRHRTDGSFVRLMSGVTNEDENQTTERLKRFAEQIFPLLNEFIPA